MAKQAETMHKLAEKNKGEGRSSWRRTGKKGVKTLPRRTPVQRDHARQGKSPKTTGTVTTHYLRDADRQDEFDSSYKRDQPATFQVSGVIPGWTEGAPVDERERSGNSLCRQSRLRRKGPAEIGPNATLIFEVKLISAK